jgi:pimeloyl-ACP methyl ester carboxylesterase
MENSMSQSDWSGNVVAEYWRDAFERSVLWLDVLRRRGNQYLEQTKRTAPNVLSFQPEVIVDGRTLPRPVNYILVRIVPPADVKIDPGKRPFIIFDPRAGHGPGIGGMKHDSEIGVALNAGHACYFVGFLPKPVPGQTIADVCAAEAHFVRAVSERHAEADGKPTLIGNCRAGWQIMMMAAMAPDLPGPIIIAGAPLSYWAGVHGKYPMRYLGGNLGGSWLTSLAGDLGGGVFDGASLVANFESNNPANTLWKKPYNVYSNVDTEAERFLDFEKWWGNPVLLNAEEMQFIVDELFVGNRLAAGKIRTRDGKRVDLRRIKSPIIVFCSFGDDITPPQQALDWILDLYKDVDELIANGQTVIYSLHQSIGHLGIFVSGKVATKEHEEFACNMNMIDSMPPGLYQIVLSDIDQADPNRALVTGQYVARLEPRTFDDIRALGGNDEADERRFETAARVSEINQGLYRTLVSPVVRSITTPASAEFMREMHPNRIRFRGFSDNNALMQPVAQLAEKIRSERHPVADDNPLLTMEKMASSWIVNNLEMFAKAREAFAEKMFLETYGSPLLQAMVGLNADHALEDRKIESDLAHAEARVEVEAAFDQGGFLEAGLRGLLYIQQSTGVDERQFNTLEALRDHAPENERVPLSKFKAILRRQAVLLRADVERALAAIPKMLPDDPSRRARAVETIHEVVTANGALDPERAERFEMIRRLFGVAKDGPDGLVMFPKRAGERAPGA